MKLVLTLWTPWEGSKDPQASADDTLRTTLVVMSPLKDVCITNTSSYFLAYLFTLIDVLPCEKYKFIFYYNFQN